MSSQFEIEVRRFPWEELRQCSDKWRQDVPTLLNELITAPDESAASAAYFRLEGACFPQRLVTESCVAVVSCLCAALSDRPEEFVGAWIIEALRGIVCGEPIRSEVDRGNDALMDSCRLAGLQGYWLLRQLATHSDGPELDNLERILLQLDKARGAASQ